MSISTFKTPLPLFLFILASLICLPVNTVDGAVTNNATSISSKQVIKLEKRMNRIQKKLNGDEKTKAHKQGIRSAVLGVLAFLLLFSSVGFIAVGGPTLGVLALLLALLLSIPALLLGMSAVKKCEADPEKRGKKLGRLGTILGGIILGLAIVVVLMAVGVIDLG